MNEKIRIPSASDTILVDGVYYPECRFSLERRRQKRKVLYERRTSYRPAISSL